MGRGAMSSACSRGSATGREDTLAPRPQPGFSLVEMMVALAVAAILFFVALPGYQHAVLKSTRAAARSALLEVIARQEQYFVNHKRYALSVANLGLPEPYYIDHQGEVAAPATSVYRVNLDLIDGAYQGATAVPQNRQASDSTCMAFSLSRLGIRSVSGTRAFDPADCW